MRKTMLPLLACLMAGSAALAQTTDTDTKIGPRPKIRIFSNGYYFSTGAFLGVHPIEVDDATATKYGMNEPYGALLNKVEENTAASKAGLQAGDIIIEWNSNRVESAAMLRRMINETPIGRKVRIVYIRNGARATAETTLDKHPGTQVFENFPNGNSKLPDNLQEMMEKAPKLGSLKMMVGDGRMGATLQSITPQLATYFGVSEQSGALVGSVRDGSAAQKGGLQVGDVIVSIDGQKVTNPGEIARAISKKNAGDKADLIVIRDKKETSLQITLDTPSMNQEFTIPNMEGLNGEMRLFKDLLPSMPYMNQEGDVDIKIIPLPQNDEQAPNASGGTEQPDLGNQLFPNDGDTIIRHTSRTARDI